MRMRGQGLGPGFTRVATRRSVIFSLDGLELVLTLLGKASVRSPANTKPPSAMAEVFSTSRRSNVFPPFFSMARCPFQSVEFLNLLIGLATDPHHLREYMPKTRFPV